MLSRSAHRRLCAPAFPLHNELRLPPQRARITTCDTGPSTPLPWLGGTAGRRDFRRRGQDGLGHGGRAEGRPRAARQAGAGRQLGRRPRALSLRGQPAATDRLSRRQLAADFLFPAAGSRGPPGREPTTGREVCHSSAGVAERLVDPERRPADAYRAVRRVRPPHLHHGHRQGAGGRHPGHHGVDAAMDQSRGHLATSGTCGWPPARSPATCCGRFS